MANVSPYTFNNMSRIGLDQCYQSQSEIQNISSGNYTTQNYFASDCSMKNPIDLATSQPGINYNVFTFQNIFLYDRICFYDSGQFGYIIGLSSF